MTLTTILSVLAAGSGAWAAWLWYRASVVPLKLPWEAHGMAPVDPVQDVAGWTFAVVLMQTESSLLNKRAALWTAVSVAITAAQSLISAFAA